jgi:hypothetical protein
MTEEAYDLPLQVPQWKGGLLIGTRQYSSVEK